MMHIYVEDADIVFAKAISEGAPSIFPMMDAFWGDRYGQVMDPYG
jgi:PhnB protein